MDRKVKTYRIDAIGIDLPDYFPGVGISGTPWDAVAVGTGDNAKEAYQDAVEQLATDDWNVDKLPTRPYGINKQDSVDAYLRRIKETSGEPTDLQYYVAVFVAEALIP